MYMLYVQLVYKVVFLGSGSRGGNGFITTAITLYTRLYYNIMIRRETERLFQKCTPLGI